MPVAMANEQPPFGDTATYNSRHNAAKANKSIRQRRKVTLAAWVNEQLPAGDTTLKQHKTAADTTHKQQKETRASDNKECNASCIVEQAASIWRHNT